MENQNIQPNTATKNKNINLNKILSIVIVALIAIFAIGTLVLAVTPKNFNIGLNDPTSIKIHTSNQSINDSKWYKDAEDGVYNKIMELYNNSFKTTLLNAMFKGVLVESASIKEGGYQYFNKLDNYIEFQYTDLQTIKINGKTYNPSNSAINKNYVSVIIEVKDTNSLSQVNAYIRHGGENTNYSYSRINFTSYANQSALYDYITSL